MLRNVTARVRNVSDGGWGTAFFISGGLAVTAAHCVTPCRNGDRVQLEFGGAVLEATIAWSDPVIDAAVLQLVESRSSDSHIHLAHLVDVPTGQIGWSAFGFPGAYPEGLTITGSISSIEGSLAGSSAVELNCSQGVDSSALNGLSGAAVCVNNSCIGIIVTAPPMLKQRVILARPIKSICAAALQSIHSTEEETRVLSGVSPLSLDSFDRSFSQYLAAVRLASERLPQRTFLSFGLAKRCERRLDEVFVPPTVRPIVMDGGQLDAASAQEVCGRDDPDCPILEVPDAIRRAQKSGEPNVFLFGDPGSGKSALLRHIAAKAWEDPGAIGLDSPHIPMLVRLGNLSECAGVVEDWLWDGMCRGGEVKPKTRPPTGYFEAWSERMKARWLLLLDGFDEVPAKSRSSMLNSLACVLDCDQYLCVITSRPAQGRSDKVWLLCGTTTCYEILPFNHSQEVMLVDKWLGDNSPHFRHQFQSMRLNASRKTPLLLTIAAAVYQRHGKLPESRAALYERLVEACLDEATQKGLEKELEPRFAAFIRPLLELIALHLTEEQSVTGVDSIARRCSAYLVDALRISPQEADLKANDCIKVLGRLSGLLFCDGRHCSWSHNTVREYLAASLLSRSSSKQELLSIAARWNEEPWAEVVLFLFSILTMRDCGSSQRDIFNADPCEGSIDVPVANCEKTSNVPELSGELANHILNSVDPNGPAALFLAAAWAEGASISWPLTEELIEFLRSSSLMAAAKGECEQVYEDLASSGRSPIELLGRLTINPGSRDALLEIVSNHELKYWARESAALACLRAGMFGDLRRLVASHRIEGKLARVIQARLPRA